MVRKRDKRKRKLNSNNIEEKTSFNNNEKYLAYVTKNTKKKRTLSNKPDDTEDLSVKPAKKKKKQDTSIDIATTANVSISAKPKINKAAIELNALISTGKEVDKTSTQRIFKNKNLSKTSKTSKHSKKTKTNIEIITPEENLEPVGSNIIHDLPSPSNILEILSS